MSTLVSKLIHFIQRTWNILGSGSQFQRPGLVTDGVLAQNFDAPNRWFPTIDITIIGGSFGILILSHCQMLFFSYWFPASDWPRSANIAGRQMTWMTWSSVWEMSQSSPAIGDIFLASFKLRAKSKERHPFCTILCSDLIFF